MNTSNPWVARIVNKMLLSKKTYASRLSVESQTIYATKFLEVTIDGNLEQ
jgi:hypothetical protein